MLRTRPHFRRRRGGQPAGPAALGQAVAAAAGRLCDGCLTAADVAARLKAAHCEGCRGDPRGCPLARWFRTALASEHLLPARHVVLVDGTTWGRAYLYAHVRKRPRRDNGACPPVRLPAPLVSFAAAFDSGGFDELCR